MGLVSVFLCNSSRTDRLDYSLISIEVVEPCRRGHSNNINQTAGHALRTTTHPLPSCGTEHHAADAHRSHYRGEMQPAGLLGEPTGQYEELGCGQFSMCHHGEKPDQGRLPTGSTCACFPLSFPFSAAFADARVAFPRPGLREGGVNENEQTARWHHREGCTAHH